MKIEDRLRELALDKTITIKTALNKLAFDFGWEQTCKAYCEYIGFIVLDKFGKNSYYELINKKGELCQLKNIGKNC